MSVDHRKQLVELLRQAIACGKRVAAVFDVLREHETVDQDEYERRVDQEELAVEAVCDYVRNLRSGEGITCVVREGDLDVAFRLIAAMDLIRSVQAARTPKGDWGERFYWDLWSLERRLIEAALYEFEVGGSAEHV